MKFYKYHALGNDYIVLEPAELTGELSQEQIRRICHRNYGIGSDGIVYGPIETKEADFALRIFNPDGSEAEKSGNGLRIFARYLFEKQYITQKNFTIKTLGGVVKAQIMDDLASLIKIGMGRVTFLSNRIPVKGPVREVINEEFQIGPEKLKATCLAIGNPHCVIVSDDITEERARQLGPLVENHKMFPNRINMQLLKIIDRSNIEIKIWERGAGYTLASGSSSCAAAAVARRLGLCDSGIKVHMPGGQLDIAVSDDFTITMTGPVTKIAEGSIVL
ncbi:MAG: diaminopimelate epimerase [Sedimentisphaerales bacterium]|nr:diaminopimelate epimerase [Sedimentisphaerales bacterium]